MCLPGGSGRECRSPRPSRGQEGEGAQPPSQPNGGPHQRWDSLWASTEGGGHWVSVSTVCTATSKNIYYVNINHSSILFVFAFYSVSRLPVNEGCTYQQYHKTAHITALVFLLLGKKIMTAGLVSCRNLCVPAVWCNLAVMFIKAFSLIKLRSWFWLTASPQGAPNFIR